jgi:hypothetical protein
LIETEVRGHHPKSKILEIWMNAPNQEGNFSVINNPVASKGKQTTSLSTLHAPDFIIMPFK